MAHSGRPASTTSFTRALTEVSELRPNCSLRHAAYTLDVTKGLKTGLIVLTALAAGAIVLVVAAVFVLASAFGFFRDNPAKKALAPITRSLAGVHPSRICDNGDSGHGVDNNQPWFTDYLSVDATPTLDATMTAAAHTAGFSLVRDQQLIDELQRNAGDTRAGREMFNPSASYLTANIDGKTLSAKIIRSGEVARYCGVKHYGQPMSPAGDKAIVVLTLSLPTVNRE